MELWFVYSLIASLGAGIISFGFKYAAVRQYDGRLVVGLMFFVFGFFSSIVWLFQGASTTGVLILGMTGIISGFANSLSNVLKVISLKYIDTAIFFPIYKTLGPFAIAVIGVWFFGDVLGRYEIAGIAAGILVPLLLIHKAEKARQHNLPIGMMILCFSVVLAIISVSAQKLAVESASNIWFFLMCTGFAGFIVSATVYFSKNALSTIDRKSAHMRETIQLGLGLGVIEVVVSYVFLRALETGLLGVVYTIVSFYILIPIVFAVWLYKEHMNARKAIAIILSILAIIFFKL